MGETLGHKQAKEKLLSLLKDHFAANLDEYSTAGHEIDVFAVTQDGTSLCAEIVWTSTRANFFRDLSLFQACPANIKIFVVNPSILGNYELRREYEKVRILDLERGILISEMISTDFLTVQSLESKLVSVIEALLALRRRRLDFPEQSRVTEVYVEPSEFVDARSILESSGFLILTGLPSVGKTACALRLASEAASSDVEFLCLD